MTEIYLWKRQENYPEKLIGRYERERSPDSYCFDEGRELSKDQIATPPIIKFWARKEKLQKYDCLNNSSLIPLVNQRIMDILLKLAPNDVQFFDTKVECEGGELEGYKLLNITHTIVGIDHERSVYTKIEVKSVAFIDAIIHLFYKPGCMGNHKLARDEECKRHILVSREIFEAFQREKITGVWLAEPEEYYDHVYGRV